MHPALLPLFLALTLPQGASYSADASASTLRYTVIHKLHEVNGVSHELEAKAVLRQDGTLLAMVRAPVTSFRSGDANRDEHMLEVLEAGKYPFVVFRGVANLGAAREIPQPGITIQGEVDLHGVKTRITLPLVISQQPDGSLHVHGAFDVSLDAHRIERPSLLFVKIEDACHIDFDLTMRPSST